jgi:hypothetical protein
MKLDESKLLSERKNLERDGLLSEIAIRPKGSFFSTQGSENSTVIRRRARQSHLELQK